jgi:hypothetical protein
MAIPMYGLRDSYKILTRFYSRKNIVESARSKVPPSFFRDIFLSNARHVPARIVLQLSFHLFASFFGFKCYRDNIVCHVAHGGKYHFSDLCMGGIFGQISAQTDLDHLR